MNSLSWYLYIADVVGGLRGFTTAVGVISLGVCILSTVIFGIVYEDCTGEQQQAKLKRNYWTVMRYAIPLAIVGVLAATLLPSRQTMYAIAASELGDKAIQSSMGQEAVAALKHWLHQQAKPITKDE